MLVESTGRVNTARAFPLSRQAGVFTVFSQFLSFVALTRFLGFCFRSQRLRLARLRGEFPDGFLDGGGCRSHALRAAGYLVAVMVFLLSSPRSS